MVEDWKDTTDTVWKDLDHTKWVLASKAPVASYAPVIRITFYFDTQTLRFAFVRDDYDSEHNYYKRTVLTCPEITTELPDIFWGVEQASNVTIELSAADDTVDDTWYEILATDEVRGRWCKIERYDPVDGSNLEFRGKIESIELSHTVRITVCSRDDQVLDTLIPQHKVTTDLFTATAQDVGAEVNICIGYCVNVPLRNIKNDTVNNHYDYLIGYGPIESLWTDATHGIKRSDATATGKLVPAAEYTLLNNTTYPGYAAIRFTVEQRDFTNSFCQLTADVKGLTMGGTSAERNPATVLKNVLTNTSWGLSENADSLSFTTAATQQTTIGNQYWDGAVTAQEQARDVVRDGCKYFRMALDRGDDGEWEVQVDVASAEVKVFGEVDGYYNNCEIESVSFASASEAVKSLTVQYAIDETNIDKPYYELTADVHTSFGVDVTEACRFILEYETALNYLSYVKNRSIYSDKTLTIRAGLEARLLKRGDVIGVIAPNKNIASKAAYKIQRLTKGLRSFRLVAREYSADIYNTEVIAEPTAWTSSAVTVAGPKSLVGSVVLGDGGTNPGRLTLQIAAGQGDTYIAAGKTDFTNVQTGFILGIDDSDSDKAKFYIGSASEYLNWDGSSFTLKFSDKSHFAVLDIANPGGFAIWDDVAVFASDTNADVSISTAHASNASEIIFFRSKGTHGTPSAVVDTNVLATISAFGYAGADYYQAAEINFNVNGTPGANDMPGDIGISTSPDGSATPVDRINILANGYVGVGAWPGQIFEVDQGSGNMIADGYDTHSLSDYKREITEAGSVLDAFKKVKIHSYKRVPHVTAEELKAAAIERFGKARWDSVYPTRRSHRNGALKDCPDAEMKAFIDETADRLRAERRLLPEWKREHLGLVADDPTLLNHPALIAKDKDGNTRGVCLNEQVSFIHAVVLELVSKVDELERKVV